MRKLFIKTTVELTIQVDDDVTMQELSDDLIVSAVIRNDGATFSKADILDTQVGPLEVTDSK